eukprot:gene151-99_t
MHHQLEATSEDIVKIDININECPTISTCQQLISHVLSSYLLRPEVSWILKKYSKLTSIEQIDNLFLLSKAAESFEILFDIIEQSVMNHHPHVKGVHIVLTVGFLEGIAPDAFNQFLQFIKAQPRAITLLLCCNMANIDQYEHCEQMSFGLRSLRQLTLSSQTLFQQLFREIVVEGDLPIVFPCELLKLLGEEFDMYTCCSRTFTRRTLRKICKVIPFVDVKELGDVSLDEETQRFSLPKVREGCERVWDQQRLGGITLRLLQVFLDRLPKDAVQTNKFTASHVWFALFETQFRPRRGKLLNDLHAMVQSTVPSLSVAALVQLVDAVADAAGEMQRGPAQELFSEAAKAHWLEIERSVTRLRRTAAALIDVLTAAATATATATATAGTGAAMDDGEAAPTVAVESPAVSAMLQWTLPMWKKRCQAQAATGRWSVEVDVSAVFAACAAASAAAAAEAAESSATAEDAAATSLTRQPSTESATATDTATATATATVSKRWISLANKVFSPSERAQSPHGGRWTVPLWVLLQGAMEDSVGLCTLLIDRFLRTGIAYDGWEGVLVLDDSAADFYGDELAPDLRHRFQESLAQPEDWVVHKRPRYTATATATAAAATAAGAASSDGGASTDAQLQLLDELRALPGVALADDGDDAPATSTSTAAATKKDAKKATSNKRKRGSGAAASDADAPATVAIGDDGGDSGACHPQPQRRSLPSSIATPDVCLLLPKAQTAATTEPLNLWFEAFALAVRQEDERIAAQKLAEEQAAAAVDADANGRGGAKKRGKGGAAAAAAASTTTPAAPTLTREEILHVAYANRALRVRFFHALFQLERAGWCSSTFSVDRGVVRVTRHFFVGV